jgi:uncharacterized coiled-coil protein SlyX
MGEGSIAALESRLSDLEGLVSRQTNLLNEQQGIIAEMNQAIRGIRDPRVDHLIGMLADVAQDPFNCSSWDRVRKVIKGFQPDEPILDDSGQ